MSLDVLVFLCAVPPAVVAVISLNDRFSQVQWEAMSKGRKASLALLLVAGPVCTVALGFWILYNPPKPLIQVVEKQVSVEKPCPPSKSGTAATKGTESPAITGSNNGVNYGNPPPPKK